MGRKAIRQEERRARTVAALLRAARWSFACHGYEHSSLDSIAASAELSKGAVYVHFATKQQLFMAIAEEALEDARDRMMLLLSQRPLPADASVCASAYFASDGSDALHVGLVFEVWRVALVDAAVRTMLNCYQVWRRNQLSGLRGEPWADLVSRLIDGELSERRLRRDEPDRAQVAAFAAAGAS